MSMKCSIWSINTKTSSNQTVSGWSPLDRGIKASIWHLKTRQLRVDKGKVLVSMTWDDVER